LDIWTITTWYLGYLHNLFGIYHCVLLSMVQVLTQATIHELNSGVPSPGMYAALLSHIPDQNPQFHCCQHLKSHKSIIIFY